MPRGWAVAAAGVVAGATGMAACSSGSDETVVTQARYDAEAVRACEQHGWALARAYDVDAVYSDAEKVSFVGAEFIPRARAVVRRMTAVGFPSAEAERYEDAYAQVGNALDELEANPWGYFERRRDAGYAPGEQPIARVERGFVDADVPC